MNTIRRNFCAAMGVVGAVETGSSTPGLGSRVSGDEYSQSSGAGSMDRIRPWRSALTVSSAYAVVAGLWVSFSDRAFLGLAETTGSAVRVSVIKGELFVLTTAVLLFLLMGRYLSRLRLSEQQYADVQQELMHKEKAIRQGYVAVLDAITGGKLILVTQEELDALLGTPLREPRALTSGAKLGEARHFVQELLGGTDLADEDAFILAFSEACTNALKHGGGGEYSVYRTQKSIQVMVKDEGPGIDFKMLPKATLVPGFSTTNTLGMGFTIMLDVSDRVLLCTDDNGTAVVLEVRYAAVPADSMYDDTFSVV